jgi:hypothetical protein
MWSITGTRPAIARKRHPALEACVAPQPGRACRLQVRICRVGCRHVGHTFTPEGKPCAGPVWWARGRHWAGCPVWATALLSFHFRYVMRQISRIVWDAV